MDKDTFDTLIGELKSANFDFLEVIVNSELWNRIKSEVSSFSSAPSLRYSGIGIAVQANLKSNCIVRIKSKGDLTVSEKAY